MTIRKKKRVCRAVTRIAFIALLVNACLVDASWTYFWGAVVSAAVMLATAWKSGEIGQAGER